MKSYETPSIKTASFDPHDVVAASFTPPQWEGGGTNNNNGDAPEVPSDDILSLFG